MKTSLDDELSLLLAVGADLPGDVQVLPAGAPLAEAPSLIDDGALASTEFRDLVEPSTSTDCPGCRTS